jgi:two-component system, sensor histidine kinase and response regulator
MLVESMTSAAPPRVLMVDDVEANLVGLEATLGNLDCELVRATSGNEALRLLLKHDFAVVLLDVQMPGMDGFEVAKLARENTQTKHIPIIFLTAMLQTEDNVLKGYGTGAVDYLLKPFNPHILRSKVIVFLDLYRSRLELTREVELHKRTSLELQRANEALRHFTHAASHDLRQPVRVMKGFLEALVDELGESASPAARDHLERSRNACERMASLLDSLLIYARLQSRVSWGIVDTRAIVDRVLSDLSERIRNANARVNTSRLERVEGDANRLYQLFSNLISNALKFSGSKGPPEISISAVAERDGGTRFCVADNGIGIDPKHFNTIFQAFGRLHSTDIYEGTGLGLTISKEIVEQHGGQLWVESTPGEGARFCFTIPAPKRAPSGTGQSPAKS